MERKERIVCKKKCIICMSMREESRAPGFMDGLLYSSTFFQGSFVSHLLGKELNWLFVKNVVSLAEVV